MQVPLVWCNATYNIGTIFYHLSSMKGTFCAGEALHQDL